MAYSTAILIYFVINIILLQSKKAVIFFHNNCIDSIFSTISESSVTLARISSIDPLFSRFIYNFEVPLIRMYHLSFMNQKAVHKNHCRPACDITYANRSDVRSVPAIQL